MRLSLAFCALLVAVSCGAPPARFSDDPVGFETREAPRRGDSDRVSRDDIRRDEFATYDDAAAERHLAEKVAEALAREIQKRDEEDRRREAEVEIARERARAAESMRGYRYHDVYGYEQNRFDRTPIPWNTLFYGGLGAVIGHQYGRRDRGLAIGAGFGLLNDMLRWRW